MKKFNFRYLYIFFVALFGYLLFYTYTSEKNISTASDQEVVSTNYLASFNVDQVHVLENSVLEVVVDLVTGNILSSRLKDYPVVPGSDGGVRILGSGLDSDDKQMRFYVSSGFADTDNAGVLNDVVFSVEESSSESVVCVQAN